MILAILAVWFGYKKARDTGRNPFLWAAICGGTFIGVQLLIGLALSVLIEIGVQLYGWSEAVYDNYGLALNLPGIAASILSLYLLFRYLDRVPEEEPATAPPPPPSF